MTRPKMKDLDLVALDLDGTVMCPFGRSPITARVRSSIERLLAMGLAVTFITGRTEDYAAPIAESFNLQIPIVTYNGGRIYSVTEKKVIYQASVERAAGTQLLEFLDGQKAVVASYFSSPKGLHLVQNHCSGNPDYDDYLFGTPRRIVGHLSGEFTEARSLSKLIVATKSQLEKELNDRFGHSTRVVRTHPELVEILPHGVDKGSGLRELLSRLKLDPRRVLAVGDQANDIATFQLVGYSAAMGDAPQMVRDSADWVTGKFSEEGCAEVLEALVTP